MNDAASTNRRDRLAAIVAPLSEMTPIPAVVVNVPPHCVVEEVATVRPAGNVSENATPVNAVPVFEFVIVKVRVVVPFNGIVVAPKDLLIEGGTTTVIEALAVFPVPPFVDVTFPVMLFCTPAVEPVTVTFNVHVPLAAIVAPLNEMIPVPAVVVNVPPHCAVEEVATVRPAGNVSVNATSVNATVFATGFVTVKVKVVVPFKATVAAPKDFDIEGGVTTATVLEHVLFASLLSEIRLLGST